MDKIEYRVSENKLGISIKRPDGLQRKRSEKTIKIRCAECGSQNMKSHKSGDLLLVACMDCPNYWHGIVGSVLTHYNSEEALIKTYNLRNFEEIEDHES